MYLSQRYVYFVNFFIFILFINMAFGAEPIERSKDAKKEAKVLLNATTTNHITTLEDSQPSTTIAVNETITTEEKEIVKVTEKPKEKEKVKDKPEEVKPKKEYKPEVVTPAKPQKPAPILPKVVVKDDDFNKVPHPSKSHPEKTIFLLIIAILGCYLCYHNKNKILGLIVEGPTGRSHGRRTPTARYRRLNTDEATVEAGIQ